MAEVRITDPKTGGQKGQKPERFDLFPFDALEEVARVYGVGAEKYADDNWLKGYAWRLSAGALLRHIARFMVGEDRDPETGCLHLAHAAWHCLTMITFELRRLGTDDRSPVKVNAKPIETLATLNSSGLLYGDTALVLYGVHQGKKGKFVRTQGGNFPIVIEFDDGGTGSYTGDELERL